MFHFFRFKPHYYFPSTKLFPSLIYGVDAASGFSGWETDHSFCLMPEHTN